MITRAVLSDAAQSSSLALRPSTTIVLQGVDFVPAIREVAEPVPGADGSFDDTQNLDAGSLTVQVAVPDGDRSVLDALAGFMAPFARPYLTVTDDGWAAPRRLLLRSAGLGKPLTTRTGRNRAVQLQWKTVNGAWEAAAATSYTGWAIGTHTATNPGNLRPAWTAVLHGPLTGPDLWNDTLGLGVVFTDSLVIASGHYVTLKSDQTAALDGDPAQSVLRYLDFAATDWWPLNPGTSTIRLAATSGSGNVDFSFSAAYL
jgi:hypothetical protein